MAEFEIGKKYDVDHAHKGNFQIRVTSVEGPIVTGVITWGVARYVNEPDRYTGQHIAVRTDMSFIRITPAGE